MYGSLQFPKIVKLLIGRAPTTTDVLLHDHRVAALKDRKFPGLISEANCTAQGKIIDITDEEFSVISDFENESYTKHFYESRTVSVVVANKQIEAITFVWTDPNTVLDTDWNKEDFQKTHLNSYIKRLSEK